jgi:antitoxin (DNA-binding transcriptional repressor) of toxin-antitoxin stability system
VAIRTANIRALKDKLSAHLREVQHGDVILVTDRGRVVAELRQPSTQLPPADTPEARLQKLADAGRVRLGQPNRPDLYGDTGIRLADAVIDATTDWVREDK